MRKIILAAIIQMFVLGAFGQQFASQWSPSDFILYASPAQKIDITPLRSYTIYGTNIVTHQTRSFSTGTKITATGQTVSGIAGTLIVSNMIPGEYKVDCYSIGNQLPTATFTNVFTNGTPAFVNAKDYVAVSTNSVSGDGYAYTINQINALLTGIGGGNATNAQPPSANLTNWSQWDTNAFANVVSNRTVSGLGTAALAPTNQFDPANTAATVGANISNNILSIVPLAGITNSGLVDSNAFFKAMPYPHAYDRTWPVPPDIFNTYYAGPIRQSNHVIFLNQLATNGWLDMSRVFHVPSYYDIDEGWSSNRVNGVDVYSPSNFPNGITDLVAIAHSLGFKIGLYGIGSVQQGLGPTNIYGNATNLLAYGIDMMKLESAANERITLSYLYPFVRVFQTNGTPIYIEGAMDTTSRDSWLNGLMNSPRILVNGDVTSYPNLLANLDYIWAHLMGGVGPGFFPSAEYANLNLTGDELTTHFAAMAMIPAPWSISMPQTTLGNVAKFGLATNRDVYWVNKDPLVRPGFLLYSNQNVVTFERSCVSNTAALAIQNELAVSTNYTFYFTNLIQTPWFKTNSAYLVRDLWNHTNSYQTNSLTISINAHAAAIFRLHPVDWLAPWGNGINQTNLNASNLASGTVPHGTLPGFVVTNNLASGLLTNNGVVVYVTNGTPALALPNGSLCLQTSGQLWSRTNSAWVAINISGTGTGGSGTVTSVDVAQQGFGSSGAVTSSGTVTLTRNADVNALSYGTTNNGFWASDQWMLRTNPANHSLVFSNLVTGANVAMLTNGTLQIGGNTVATTNQLLGTTNLAAGQFAAFDANTSLTATLNAATLTNMPFTSLSFSTNLGPNTNWVIGWINFTNGGRWMTIPICTNQ